MVDRRTLAFASLDEIMPDVDRLLVGYRAVGRWTLGQVCNHLASGLRASVEGFAEMAPLVVRKTLGPVAKRQILVKGRMREGIKLAEKYQPRPQLDDRAEAEALRASLHLFSMEAGPLAPHPFLGPLSTTEWQRFHCVHSAHHLSFLQPEAG